MNELLTMLDTKYKRLEYIQSTGTQWIDLGLTANQDTTIKCRVSNVNSGTQPFIGLSDANNLTYGIGQQTDGNYLFGQYYKTIINNGRIVSDIAGNDGIIRNFELRKNEFYIDNVLIGSITYHTFTTQNTIKLFTLNPSSSKASIKMYNAEVLDGNMNLLKNMIPVMRKSDNEIGMLDLVEGKFYTNAGTGKFTANLDTMYAVIQGSPTVQDGRVSNFRATNYLKTKAITLGTNFEIKISFITPNDFNASANKNIIGFGTSIYWLSVISDGRIRYRYSSYGSAINYIETGILATNTKYDLILGQQQSGTIYLKYKKSSESEYITVTRSYDATIFLSSNEISFGASMSSYPRPFDKSIDLNRSYIKIDDTKYKLQAVVGYTVVGSPTITDGVVSGFSSENYLSLPSVDFSFPFEFKIVFTTSDANNSQNVYGFIVNNYPFGIGIVSNKSTYLFSNNTKSGLTLLANTTYISKIIFDGETLIGKIGTNENNLQLDCIIPNCVFGLSTVQRIGISRIGTAPFLGSININETYIKINNKLWFNGQEG